MMTIPVNPSAIPDIFAAVSFSLGKNIVDITATENGKTANKIDVKPEETCCSPQYTNPNGIENEVSETTRKNQKVLLVNGTSIFLALIIPKSKMPATIKRSDAESSGVIVSRPILITSHVDPQMVQMAM